jgi:hypothetical protein
VARVPVVEEERAGGTGGKQMATVDAFQGNVGPELEDLLKGEKVLKCHSRPSKVPKWHQNPSNPLKMPFKPFKMAKMACQTHKKCQNGQLNPSNPLKMPSKSI